MAKSEPASWPKTADGTTDWELVFEHPESGLIPIIMKAPTPMALRECTRVVVENLHTRPDDKEEIARFIAELKQLVPDNTPASTLPLVGEAVTSVLRQVKEERKDKAAKYVAEQRAKGTKPAPGKSVETAEGAEPTEPAETAKPDDAAKPAKPPAGRRPVKKAKDGALPWSWVIGGAGVVGVVAAVIGYLVLGGDDDPEKQSPNLVLLEEIKQAAVGEGPPTHVFGGALYRGSRGDRTMITAEEVPADACMSITWPLSNLGVIVIGTVIPQRISPGILKELCEKSGAKTTVIWLPRKAK